MSYGKSSELPSSSILSGKEVTFLEPISKIGTQFVAPFFRVKTKAPEGSTHLWTVRNDTEINYVDGRLVWLEQVEQPPYEHSGRTQPDVYVNYYLEDTEDPNHIQIIQSKMTSLGRDLANCMLSVEPERPVRVRLYQYNRDKLRAGVCMETDLDSETLTRIKWKFDKSKVFKARKIDHPNGEVLWDWTQVDNLLFNELDQYARINFYGTNEHSATSEPSMAVKTEAPAQKQGFYPTIPTDHKSYCELIFRVCCGKFKSLAEVNEAVKKHFEGTPFEDARQRKRFFWGVLTSNLPGAITPDTKLDTLVVIAYYSKSSIFAKDGADAIHSAADSYRDFGQRHKLTNGALKKAFITAYNKML